QGASFDEPTVGTAYIVMHSLRGEGVGPGNLLFDTLTGDLLVSEGDVMIVADSAYEVRSFEVSAKDALPTASTVWESVPNRLVVITCLQNSDGSASVRNLVITAEHRP